MLDTVEPPQYLPVWLSTAMVLRDSNEPCCRNVGNINSLMLFHLGAGGSASCTRGTGGTDALDCIGTGGVTRVQEVSS